MAALGIGAVPGRTSRATITVRRCSPLAASPSRMRSRHGITWLKTEVPDYWDQRLTAIAPLLDYLGKVDTDHWRRDAAAARLLRGAVDIGWGPGGTRSHIGAIVLDSFGIDRSHKGRTHARDDQRPHQRPSTETGA